MNIISRVQFPWSNAITSAMGDHDAKDTRLVTQLYLAEEY